ncbi:MAG: efflux RND transporter permease subunit [Burkholderiaceae bacterium]|nr:efflux RND transporter permease subunit [Burkholderiaceae bacterium]MCD8566089.1 efflux RND transporter permease subunit [Burkholderiaceae bacterium]
MSFPNLSALAVRERSITLFFLILSVLAGLYAFNSLGRAEDPPFTVRAMVVTVLWPGATPTQLQDQVVDRLEKRVQEVDYFYKLETTIRPGRADLLIEFQDYSPSDVVPDLFYEVRKRMLDEAPSLPAGVVGPIVNDSFADVYFTMLALTAPGLPMSELTRDAESIRDKLQRIEGVQKVFLLGERPQRIHLDFDLGKLANLGISSEAVLAAIDANNRLVPAGFFETSAARVYVRVPADLSDPQTLANVPLRINDRLIRLGDIATIERGYQDPPSYMIRAGGQDTIVLGVVMRAGENGLLLGERLAAFLQEQRAQLPLGMELTQLTNQADAISGAVSLFQVKFLVAMAVVMAVSILAIGLRAGLIVGLSIPITLGLTFLLMKMTGMNLDRISLGALIIALGLLVDDAIIAIEMMIVKMEQGWDRVRAATHAWQVTAAPMLFGTLVTVAGFVPIGFAQSAVGEYAGGIFWVLAFALLVSWLVAVTFTPYLGVKLLPKMADHHIDLDTVYSSPNYQRLRRLVQWCVNHKRRVVLSTVALLLLSIAGMAGPVEKQFFPSSDRPEVLISIYMPEGTSIANTDAVVKRLESNLAGKPQIKSLSAYIGAGAPRFFISANPERPDPGFAKVIAVTNGVTDRESLIAELQQQIDAGEYAQARVRVARLLYGPPVDWPVSFRITGPDPQVLREIGHAMVDIMRTNPNIVDPNLDWDERAPYLNLDLDAQRLQTLGLTPLDVAQQLQFQLDGVPVTNVREDTRQVQVRARALPETGLLLQNVEIRTPNGRKLPLSQLGTAKIEFEEPVIKRYNREPFLYVNSDVVGAQPPDATMAVWQKLQSLRDTLPTGYQISIAGSIEQSGKADASIQKLQPLMVGLMLIFIMLQMRSFSGTFMVVATAPLGLIGAVLALLLFGQPFGFVALLGLIGLAGILMRNTLILTQQVKDNVEEGMALRPAVIEAAVQRARPVILTALAAALAFIPLTFDSFWGPLAYVLIGGVLVGTVITILFVPALYAWWFRIDSPKRAQTEAQ